MTILLTFFHLSALIRTHFLVDLIPFPFGLITLLECIPDLSFLIYTEYFSITTWAQVK